MEAQQFYDLPKFLQAPSAAMPGLTPESQMTWSCFLICILPFPSLLILASLPLSRKSALPGVTPAPQLVYLYSVTQMTFQQKCVPYSFSLT